MSHCTESAVQVEPQSAVKAICLTSVAEMIFFVFIFVSLIFLVRLYFSLTSDEEEDGGDRP